MLGAAAAMVVPASAPDPPAAAPAMDEAMELVHDRRASHKLALGLLEMMRRRWMSSRGVALPTAEMTAHQRNEISECFDLMDTDSSGEGGCAGRGGGMGYGRGEVGGGKGGEVCVCEGGGATRGGGGGRDVWGGVRGARRGGGGGRGVFWRGGARQGGGGGRGVCAGGEGEAGEGEVCMWWGGTGGGGEMRGGSLVSWAGAGKHIPQWRAGPGGLWVHHATMTHDSTSLRHHLTTHFSCLKFKLWPCKAF